MVDIIHIDERAARIYGRAMDLSDEDIEACAVGCRGADPALAFIIGHRPVAMAGFVPTALISGTAYGWMQWTADVYRHRTATARTMHAVIGAVRTRYPRIIGHCSAGGKSERWFRRLGARFAVDTDGRPIFMIGDYV